MCEIGEAGNYGEICFQSHFLLRKKPHDGRSCGFFVYFCCITVPAGGNALSPASFSGGATEAVLLFVSGSIILTFAIGKGWYGVPKRTAAFLWGGIGLPGAGVQIEGLPMRLESSFFFLWLMNHFGSIAGILLITAFGVLFARMFGKIARQTNRLVPYSDQNLPVFSDGGPFILTYYGLLGLYLSGNSN